MILQFLFQEWIKHFKIILREQVHLKTRDEGVKRVKFQERDRYCILFHKFLDINLTMIDSLKARESLTG